MAAIQALEMVRGDTLTFELKLSDLNGATVTSIYFTAKKKANDETAVFQKSLSDGISASGDDTYIVRVAPGDTTGVAAGGYVYDLQVGIGTDIYTVLMGKLTIIQDITN